MGNVSEVAIARAASEAPSRRRTHMRRAVGLAVVWIFVLGNAAAIFWLWANGGNLSTATTGEALTSVARITGLLSAYMALIQVILLARLPVLERLVGFDRLTVWHRWNGHATIDLVVAHVFFSIWGYALMDKFSIGKEISTMIWGGVYPGMIVATIGTAFLIAVVATSYVIVRRRLRYEWWYAVHVLAYAGIALAWFHQIPTGNELVLDTVAADYWRALYVATIAIIVGFRVVVPLVNVFRYRLRVAEVVEEGPGVVSVRIEGRRLARVSSSSGGSSRAAAGRRRIRSHSRRLPTGGRSGSPSRRSETTRPSWHRSPSGPASSPKGRSASSRIRCSVGASACSSPAASASRPFAHSSRARRATTS